MSDAADDSHEPTAHLRFVRRRLRNTAPHAKPVRVLQQWWLPAASEAGRGAWPEWRDVVLDKSAEGG